MSFDYEQIPEGFYDKIFEGPDGVRKFWHWHKFDSVLRCIEEKPNQTFLDIGCFSGSFIGRFVPHEVKATGVDILQTQIRYAERVFASSTKSFLYMQDFADAKEKLKGEKFDIVTFIEVIEHLNHDQIRSFFDLLESVTSPGSQVVISTPNYLSIWPLLEVMLNQMSDVTYEEQHLTKFTYFNIMSKLEKIVPGIKEKYRIEIKATTHFVTPLISAFTYDFAVELSSKVSPIYWHNPFGCITVVKLVRI